MCLRFAAPVRMPGRPTGAVTNKTETIMVKIKEEKKIPTPEECAEMARLEVEADRLLEALSRNPTDKRLIDRLNWLDIAYVRLSGEKSMEY